MARHNSGAHKYHGGKWMQHLHIKKGALTAKANRAHMGVQEFAHKHDKGSSVTAKESRLAEVFAKVRHK